jgi:hypothetical protein
MIPHPSETLRHTTAEIAARHNTQPPPPQTQAAHFTSSTKHRPHHNRTISMSNQTWVAFPRLVYLTNRPVTVSYTAPTCNWNRHQRSCYLCMTHSLQSKFRWCTLTNRNCALCSCNTNGFIVNTRIKKHEGCRSFQVFQFRFEYMSTKVFVETL